MSKQNPIIVWFRRDLRLSDNPALYHAVSSGRPIICLYIWETDKSRDMGAAQQVWLGHSLKALSSDITSRGGTFIIRSGAAQDVLSAVMEETGADSIHWNRRYAEDGREIDAAIKEGFKTRGLAAQSHKANLLSEPFEIRTKTDGYYKVFSPYWRAARAYFENDPFLKAPPIDAPKVINGYEGDLRSDELPAPKAGRVRGQDWREMVIGDWEPGEAGAAKRLKSFLGGPVLTYKADRDRPDIKTGTSRLSAHLAHGEISPREIWHACRFLGAKADKFLSEIGWREFSYVLLFHNPKLAHENFKSDFNAFPWAKDDGLLERWKRGQTGYPFVDAGMRELYQTGWQHNRVRMVCASFLIKHLLIDWREGEDWYWDTLLEADPASNAASWQWVAGSGADAAPYFRIFNPFTQGEKFDPNGDYVREFVPELKHMPAKFIHRPWEAPELVLKEAGVSLGGNYSKPVVDHKFARERALAAYQQTRGG